VHSVADNFELVDAKLVVQVALLCLVSNVSLYPLRLDGVLALVVDILLAQFETRAHIVLSFKWKFRELGKALNDITHDHYLLLLNSVDAIVNFNVCLETLTCNFFSVTVFHLHYNLERELLQSRYFVSEVA